jgi:hypothetical protein
MGRSVFILNSPKKRLEKLQFRKLSTEIGDHSLRLEGPCKDSNGAIWQMTENIRKKMDYGMHPVAAAMALLAPKNASAEKSWLKVPFVVSLEHTGAVYAGGVVQAETVEYGDENVRPVSREDLALLLLAVLRRLQVESYFSYIHGSLDLPQGTPAHISVAGAILPPEPCILVPGKKPQLLTLLPFDSMDYPLPYPTTSVEVLDDDALLSLRKLNAALHEANLLMGDMAKGNPYYHNEDKHMARTIGHLLFEGRTAWTPQEVNKSAATYQELFHPSHPVVSVRDIVQSISVDPLVDVASRSMIASVNILCKELQTELSKSDEYKMEEIKSSHSCVERLINYLYCMQVMDEHMHPQKQCSEAA